ncbi:MAG: DUF4116 domain-containing protein [Legionella sp.]|uniref:DUF4116 domain-containing protein n=1 Tax=Legionella sp. TaxID=459 RepID=UPI0039E2EA65
MINENSTREEILAVLDKVQHYGYFKNAAPALKDDKEFVMTCMKRNGGIYFYQYISERLQNDEEFALPYIRADGRLLQYATAQQNNRKFALAALSARVCSVEAIEYIAPELLINDIQVMVTAARKNPKILEKINIPSQWKNNELLMLDILKKQSKAFTSLSKHLQNDRQFILKALKINARVYPYIPNNFQMDEEIALTAIEESHLIFDDIPEDLQNNKSFFLKALNKHIELFDYRTPKQFLNAKDIVLRVVVQDGERFLHASEAMQKDRDVILTAALALNEKKIELIPEEIRERDEQLIEQVVQLDERAKLALLSLVPLKIKLEQQEKLDSKTENALKEMFASIEEAIFSWSKKRSNREFKKVIDTAVKKAKELILKDQSEWKASLDGITISVTDHMLRNEYNAKNNFLMFTPKITDEQVIDPPIPAIIVTHAPS